MKTYNNEPAIISLTSWKKRISTVSKTIVNLLKNCPGFHIVLTLSSDEFPEREKELPEDLMLLCNENLLEILWCKRNYFSLKKVLFTIKKYPEVPVISADDDCYYDSNYAKILYDIWCKNKNALVTNNGGGWGSCKWGEGPSTLYPPNFIKYDIEKLLDAIINKPKFSKNEDAMYGVYAKRNNIPIAYARKRKFYTFHDEVCPQSKTDRYVLSADVKFFESIFNELDSQK